MLLTRVDDSRIALRIQAGALSLERKVVEIDGFQINVYSEKSKHPRPHCHITGHGIEVSIDIESLEIPAGDPKPRRRDIENLVSQHRERLMEEWTRRQPSGRQISN